MGKTEVRDKLHEGQIVLWQPARGEGYRVNVDAIHLARFAARDGRVAGRAVDLGSGVGAVGLTLLHDGAVAHVTFVDKDPELLSLCARNIAENAFDAQARDLEGDVGRHAELQAVLGARANLVVANPPYVPPGRGRPPSSQRSAARSGEVEPFVVCARALLARRGRVCFVYPAHETMRLLTTFRNAGLEPKRARFVHASATSPARVVLIEACPGKPGGLIVEPPLVES